MEVLTNILEWLEKSPMLGVLVNFITVLAGATIGLILSRGIPQRVRDTLMKGLGLCVLFIGIQGITEGKKPLVTILSIVLGGLFGELLKIDDAMKWIGNQVEKKFKKEGAKGSVAEGFISASLVFIVGAMSVVGSLESGLKCDHTTAYAKSMLDFVSSMIFASQLGFGVLLGAFAVLVYQGALTVLASFLAPLLSEVVITEMSVAGSLMILGLGLNLLELTKIKVANFLPAVFLPILLCMFM